MPRLVRMHTPKMLVGTEHAHERARHVRRQIGGHLRKLGDRRHEAAVVEQDGHDDGDDADQHDDSLQKVVHHRGHVAANYDVDAGHNCHADNAPLIGQAERHAEQTRQAVVDARRVGDEEDENNGRGGNAQGLRVVAEAEELRHRGSAQAMRHLACARAEHPPSKQAAEDRVGDSRPECGDAIFPPELTGVPDKNDG